MNYDNYDWINGARPMAVDFNGNVLDSKAVQSWYNPPDILPSLKSVNSEGWTKYLDVDFDWIWGVPTTKKLTSKVKTGTINTIQGIKNIIPKTATYFMTALVLIAAIIIVPRLIAVKG